MIPFVLPGNEIYFPRIKKNASLKLYFFSNMHHHNAVCRPVP
jgi:hypothetical protein